MREREKKGQKKGQVISISSTSAEMKGPKKSKTEDVR